MQGNGGFVRNYAETHPDDPAPGIVMGYYTGASLPVHDHLVEAFCVCDHWFSSVPGATMPNRLYALTGKADGSRRNDGRFLYNLPSFLRRLDERQVTWAWYAPDPLIATLRVVDRRYLADVSHMHFFVVYHEHGGLYDHIAPRWPRTMTPGFGATGCASRR